MKKLLLTSAIVAVAGAAAAEVTWSGDAEIGYASHDDDGVVLPDGSNGIYVDAGLTATASAELDNGITASIEYGINADYQAEGETNEALTLDDFPTIKLESSVANFSIGGVDHAAEDMFTDVGGMDVGFTEVDDELVARVDTMVSTYKVGLSTTVSTAFDDDDTYGLPESSISLGASGELMGASATLGYESNADTDASVMGISVGYTWNGITGTIAYASKTDAADLTDTSIGLGGSYEMSNGMTLGFAVAQNDGDNYADSVLGYEVSLGFKALGADVTLTYEGSDLDDDTIETAGVSLDASYTIEGTGVTILAGYDWDEKIVLSDDENVGDVGAFYVGTSYDLGGGASVFATYSNGDEIGAPEYEPGARFGVALSF